ncbi:hypothetical protein CQW23_23304 [Capsicum baccatum]|uniref:Glabrous enhancer-binding protein-like DBD domain-containing protein n=1 Tax=Capsicum baccatum TaxID=33114 RepID=A0A2G2VRK0_CAPBA|nr:hypothetical protein CQW23_23304 [Capsicum baccatum]
MAADEGETKESKMSKKKQEEVETPVKKKAIEHVKLQFFRDYRVQLQDKIRRLKKYMNNAGKEKGKERVLTKAHEQKEYELSKKIRDKEKSDKWVQVEVVKVDNVAASMGLKKGGVKDNGVLFEVNEEKQGVEVEKAVELKRNLNLILCVENVSSLRSGLKRILGCLAWTKGMR